ncbi:dephospho-CoA kinase [Bacilli bacterium PM5-9]|nr:dephospho-CoA kinase [Bacilli bacterium PM5-9]
MSKMSKVIVGITGNIACGKSSVVSYLTKLGYQIIDTDVITQNIYDNSSFFKTKLEELFGYSVIENGAINKKEVSRIVFNDKNMLNKLNELIHPLIKEEVIHQLASCNGLVFLDVPLLFEANFDDLVDYIVVVKLDKDKQLERLIKRNNLSKSEALLRINAQMKQELKIEKADYVLDNNFSLQELYQQVDNLLIDLKKNDNLIIGSHVSMSAPNYILGCVKEAISYNANTFMFYTGAPQNTKRRAIDELKVEEAKKLMLENNIDINNIVVHAPYIINLANTIKPDIFDLAKAFLKDEIKRVEKIGAQYLILHPGSHVKAGEQIGLDRIVEGLNAVLDTDSTVYICLETMSGKGSELGYNFEQLAYIINNVKNNHLLMVCLDTCHIHDAGYDIVSNFDQVLDDFDRIIGLEKLKVIHINDSKNDRGASKDRHANVGYGMIGFDALKNIVNHPKLSNVIKILETPWHDGKPYYKKEIEMFRKQKFEEGYLDNEI